MSWLHRFNEWIKLKPSEVQSEHGKWSNVDLDPVPPEKKTWRSHHFVTYRLCDAVAPGNLRLGSSIMTLGFSWRETIGIIFLGHFLISLAITANAIIGAKYHVPYTVQSRTSFGFFASFVAVFIRMLVGFFWYGINTYNGALCVNAVLLAIWPSFRNVPNRLPESANITTQMMTGTMAVNINDFARYARSTRMVYAQILAVPLSFMLMSFMGIIIAGAASDLYGTPIWDPLTIMSYWSGSSGARAAAAFVSLSFVLAQLGANISANCISASNDLNAMFPSYVNLRRGSYIIAFVGTWALTPWKILASASTLPNFMDGYIIWLAPITGILLADYYVVHRQTYDVAEILVDWLRATDSWFHSDDEQLALDIYWCGSPVQPRIHLWLFLELCSVLGTMAVLPGANDICLRGYVW
ncbi:hypothetical protein BU23DRAFT_595508 [Bimuria novae-zelandiae CBS 107.79]|uniref:Allantoin permease n=1 Tax=Bimuria novae-zelandiae CBS 107.79 TaxID=1447943 RepID=A0A6A5VNY2_9PLEO|nr:hypothetical protein BU23DRAFT_595508 [Bimuria novae-zelandiae CBS 107.79]